MKYLKEFSTHSEYEQYINGSGAILPNVSICTTEGDVHYNPSTPPTPPTETRLVCKYNVTDISELTNLYYEYEYYFSSMEIDGVEQAEVDSYYQFDTLGEHTVKYTLTDPTTIGEYAFYDCSDMTAITIPNSVTSIGQSAFEGCSGLTRLNSNTDSVFNIPSGITSIGFNAFAGCSGLTSVTITNSVTFIDQGAFNYCTNLTSVSIPNSVTIEYCSFAGCRSLDAASIAAIEAINEDALFECS